MSQKGCDDQTNKQTLLNSYPIYQKNQKEPKKPPKIFGILVFGFWGYSVVLFDFLVTDD